MSLAVKLGLPKRCTCRHPKQYRIFCDECSSEDRKKIAAYRKQCTELTKGRASSLNRKRRLAEQSDGSVSIFDLKKMRQDADKCPYCLKAMIDSDKHSVVDHIIPLSKGGLHSTHNLTACCFGCNASKGSKSYPEWLDCLEPEQRKNAEKLYRERYGHSPIRH